MATTLGAGETFLPHDDGSFEAEVREVSTDADGVRTLFLTGPGGTDLPAWLPGAHIDLIISDNLERQYSLSGDPADRATWRIGVLLEPKSRGGSAYVHTSITAGARVRVRGPRNEFPLAPAPRYIFIAGGIGITPLLPMIAKVHEQGAEWTLIYGGRQRSSMAFVSELSPYGDRVTLWPQDTDGLIDLARILANPRPDTLVYCCGPGPLIDAVEAQCVNWPAHSLHVERFAPKEGALDGPSTSFEVHLQESGLTLTVNAGETIADAVQAAGVDILTSCREGICGTCETTVLEGVPDHRDSMLTAEEKASNETMMICCSRALSPVLVLDL